MILITGATGAVGRPLVHELARAGHKVRALTRTPATAGLPPEVEVARTEDLPLNGVTSIFMNPAVFWNGLGDLLTRAVENRVRRVVLLSSLAAAAPPNPIGAHHLEFENQIEASGLEWTFLRPGAFAANTLQWADQIRADGVVRGPYADAHTAPIDERDIAAVAAKALTTDAHIGTKPLLTGPESLTNADQARIIGETLGRPVRYEEISPEAAREAMTGGFAPAEVVDALLSMYAAAVNTPAEVLRTVEQITTNPPRTFKTWTTANISQFQQIGIATNSA
ncbi:NAD(P)H-binding protein [Actinomadura vinacea]|uniref:NAD(P)H-binding protein n=2 Tax=Actinomadura vinacea TaxID=115336 RepID=A0ABN3IFR1_9ACTN